MLEARDSKREFSITMPASSASVIALEGHGLNDRCSTYSIFSNCVSALGGAFGSVVITFDGPTAVTAVMAISKDGMILSWIGGDIVELVAFALHVQLPIYVRDGGESDAMHSHPQTLNTPIPGVFEDALSDILRTGHDKAHDILEEDGAE